jgi:proton-coupled amino acid transporter
MQWGCCASYMLFFMTFFEYAFYNNGVDIPAEHILVYMSLALCLIGPLVLINNISVFAKFSIISIVICVL